MKPDGGRAFPGGAGLTLRDLIAIVYLHARTTKDYPDIPKNVSMKAYEHADAMIAERDK